MAAWLPPFSFPLTTPLLERLIGASWHDTPWVTPVLCAMILGGVAGVMAIVALSRDHSCSSSRRCWASGPGLFPLGELLGLGG